MKYFRTAPKPFIRAFIISDAFLYSSLNIVNILFVVYVTTSVPGGTIESATLAVAAGLTARILVELTTGKLISRLSERHKLNLIIFGMAAITLSYAGFAFAHDFNSLALLWVVGGAGWAIGYPAKLALVARHLTTRQSSQEWATSDALNMTLIVVTMLMGSYIVSHFNYAIMFLAAAALNCLGLIPYLLYSRSIRSR